MLPDEAKEYDARIELISEKQLEYQNVISTEINRLSCLLSTATENLSSKTEQFDELREAFIYNLKLLEIKEDQLNQLTSRLSVLKKNFDQQTVQLQKVGSSLERSQSEFLVSRKTEAILKQELLVSRTCIKEQEIQLIEQHAGVVKALNKTHSEKQDELETELKNLHQTIDIERSKAARELERALKRALDKSDEQTNKSKQKQIELDLKLRVSENKFEKLTTEKQELESRLEACKNENDSLRLEHLQVCEQMKSLLREFEENKFSIQLKNKKLEELEEAKQQVKLEQERVNCQLRGELDNLKNQLQSHDVEIRSQTITFEHASIKAASRLEEMTQAIAREQQKLQSLLHSLEESKTARQIAETSAFRACAEAERLRKDLERLLLPSSQLQLPTPVSSKDVCRHTDLVDQLDRLQRQCDELQCENSKLRKVRKSDSKKEKPLNQSNVDGRKLGDKLQLAKLIIQKLTSENQALIELSNRLQSQLREPVDTSAQKQQRSTKKNPIYRTILPEKHEDGRVKRNPESDDAFSSLMDNDSAIELFKLLDDNASSLLAESELTRDKGRKPIKITSN